VKKHISFNGDIIESFDSNLYTNRAFKFGDGVFESIRILNGKPLFLDHHINRLIAGANAMKIEVSPKISESSIRKIFAELCHINKINESGRARLTFFRAGEGAYQPTTNEGSYVIEMIPIEKNSFDLNSEGLIVDTFKLMQKSLDQFSKFKTLNSLLYVQAAIYAKENSLHDSLILNRDGNIIESSKSNIFIVSNGVLYTPPLEDGCVGGVMRMNIINIAIDNNVKVYECSLKPQNLLIADEVFLTNTIKGLEWVRGFQNKRYFNDISKKIITLLNNKCG
jgi:branched-subunit amino acid aminotransferase/4-amino-4-deoxychorismate lyase